MPETPRTLFDKATEIIRRLQQAQWGEFDEGGRTQSTINVQDFITDHQEARCICGVARNILSLRFGNSHAVEVYPPTEPKDFSGTLDVAIGRNFVEPLKTDRSLDLPSTPLRNPTDQLKPENLRQAMDYSRWKEAKKWLPREDGDGFCYGMTVSHGGFDKSIFFNEDYVEDANHMVRQQQPTVQIHDDGRSTLWVSQKDAKAVLVDFIGLDAKQLNLQTSKRTPRTV